MTSKHTTVDLRVPCTFAGADKLGRPRLHKVTVVIDKIAARAGEPARFVVRTIDCSCAHTPNAKVARAVDHLGGASLVSCVEYMRGLWSVVRGENSMAFPNVNDAVDRLVNAALHDRMPGRLAHASVMRRADRWGVDFVPRTHDDRRLLQRARRFAPSNLRPAVEVFRYSSAAGYEGWWVRSPPDIDEKPTFDKLPWPAWCRFDWLLTADRGRLERQYPVVPGMMGYRSGGRTSPRDVVEFALVGPTYCRLCKSKIASHKHPQSEVHSRRLGKLIEVLAHAETCRRNIAGAPTSPPNPFSGAPS